MSNIALESIKAIVPLEPSVPLAWVDRAKLATAQTLPEALTAWGWTFRQHWAGTAIERPERAIWGDDELLLDALCPFAMTQSTIAIVLEDSWSHNIFHREISFTKRGIFFVDSEASTITNRKKTNWSYKRWGR